MKIESYTFLSKLLSFLTFRQKFYFVGVFFIFLIFAVFNVFSYVIIAPLVGLASGGSLNIGDKIGFYLYPLLGKSNFLIKFSFFVLFLQLVRVFFKFFVTYISNFFSNKISKEILSDILTKNINLSYVDYQKKDFHLVNRDLSLVNRYSQLLLSVLNLFSSFIILLTYVSLLFYLSYFLTGFIFLYFGIVFSLFQLILKKKIVSLGKEANSKEVIQSRSSTLIFRNFKFIKTRGESIDSLKWQYIDNGFSLSWKRSWLSIFQALNSSLIELSGIIILIGLVLYFNYYAGGINDNLGLLSVYAISFYRIIPVLNEILSHYYALLREKNTVDILHSAFGQSQEEISYKGEIIRFEKEISFSNVSFEYELGKPVLQNISLNIYKGDRIGIVGESGTGKTTLGDILIGLLIPCRGEIKIDQEILTLSNLGRWRKSVGYIPQSIFLFDGTVAENLAFDLPIDKDKMIEILEKTKLWDLFKEKEGLETKISLDGNSLSGGQKQRLGIARTLYRGADLIVLDEATSALDSQTESQIMDEIYKLSADITLFIIAHRLSTLDQCNKIIHMEKGQIKMVETRESFS